MSKFNIKILAHRGFWKEETEKNTKIAFERAFNSGFGIETDPRWQRFNACIEYKS